ncbi:MULTISPECIES: EFR1 family ferrodoxin [Methanobacterium]|uniref:EFR1 family ferrodoxin n=1 Tax=Methanobacterium formicicum TaxID=2162 RepID=A0A843AK46_METFO|nr:MULTISPECIES: EFR1 family ferrodoxin [Methanobacterium]KUK72520.1 MAG: Indolepyruvate ferredoxin oxidreductase, alpha/beta subunit [Methanobacterium sp. 42_16]MBF4474176.1 EFR1 family ferrodoxin [Methanobacterium formicicum]
MDKVEIYYFSGSGNSFAVARDVALELNAVLTPIMAVINQENIDTEANIIGFVFPIYDFKPPQFMEKFISRIKDIQSKYIFALCTYGVTPSNSLKHLETTINSYGGRLSAGFAVGMPQNGLGSRKVTETQQEMMFSEWKNRVKKVSAVIKNRQKGEIETSILFFHMFKTQNLKLIPVYLTFLNQVLFKGVDSLAFTSNENCTGCGTCQKICTQNNVELVDNKPKWSDHCLSCFACLNWCPNGAINPGDSDLGIRNYHHPEVKISDMILP